MKNRVFIDTSIFMYARGNDHALKAPCAQIILAIARDGTLGNFGAPVVNAEVLQEILYRYIMIEKGDIGLSICKDIFALDIDVLSVTKDDMNRVFELFERYRLKNLPPRDLIHAAVMINNGISTIFSADKHFDAIKEIKRVRPEQFARSL
ncbi:MAG: type II toxin-antitoxin system VapC family toxin [Nitrospirae bacterium]|nr:type II toxin-antitoxin system VapC family toxin [Nitrospirota bacterium]